MARGVALRHDWGPQPEYTSGHFQGSRRWLAVRSSPAFAGEPSCNGCADRLIRTLPDQCLWARPYEDADDLRRAAAEFVRHYSVE